MPKTADLFDSVVAETKARLGLKPLRVEGLHVLHIEPLSREDLASAGRGPEHPVPTLAKIRTKHHRIARWMALGLSPIDISSLTGDQPAWISRLTNSPAFRNLLEHYQGQIDQTLLDLTERFHFGSDLILDRILAVLGDESAELDLDTLMKLGERFWDRAGYGPAKRVQLNATFFSGEDLLRMKELVHEEQRGSIVSVDFQRDSTETPDQIPSNSGPAMGSALAENPTPSAHPKEAEGGSGEGSGV